MLGARSHTLVVVNARVFLLLAYIFIIWRACVRFILFFFFNAVKLLFIDTNCDISKDGQLALQ